MSTTYQTIFEIHDLDDGIVEYIHEINNLGYKTIMSCSGMRKDHYHNDMCPFICFTLQQLSDKNFNKFFCFIGDCLYNSNWYIECYPQYIVGYLPCGLNDDDIEYRFQKLVSNLQMRDFLEYSY